MDSRKGKDKRSTIDYQDRDRTPPRPPNSYGSNSNHAHYSKSMDVDNRRRMIISTRKPDKKYIDFTVTPNGTAKIRQEHNNDDNELCSRKRCFSPEVFALGRKIILTKKSSVDVSFVPEKRLCLEEFGMRRRQHRIHVSHSSEANADRWKKDLRSLLPPPQPRQLALINCHQISKISRQTKSEPRLSPFSVSKIFLKDSQRPGLLSALFSTDSFPWEKWSQSNFSVDTFRKILLSGKDLVAVSVIETEDHIFVKFVSISDVCKEQSPLHQSSASSNLLFKALRVPITLPFQVIGGIINWIFRD